jgi:hypothetical protein
MLLYKRLKPRPGNVLQDLVQNAIVMRLVYKFKPDSRGTSRAMTKFGYELGCENGRS